MDENKKNINDNLMGNEMSQMEGTSLFADSSMSEIEDEFAGIDLDNPANLQEQAASTMFNENEIVQNDKPEVKNEQEAMDNEPLKEDKEEEVQQALENSALEELASQTQEEFLKQTQMEIEEKKEEDIAEQEIKIGQKQTVQKVEKVATLETEEECNSTGANEMITVRPVKFPEFEPTLPNRTIKKNLDIMQDISMHVSVELGKTKSSIKDVMEMEEGSIVELDKIAGEQVEVYVNGKLVAKGEVIVIEDKFGVRITSTNLPKTIE